MPIVILWGVSAGGRGGKGGGRGGDSSSTQAAFFLFLDIEKERRACRRFLAVVVRSALAGAGDDLCFGRALASAVSSVEKANGREAGGPRRAPRRFWKIAADRRPTTTPPSFLLRLGVLSCQHQEGTFSRSRPLCGSFRASSRPRGASDAFDPVRRACVRRASRACRARRSRDSSPRVARKKEAAVGGEGGASLSGPSVVISSSLLAHTPTRLSLPSQQLFFKRQRQKNRSAPTSTESTATSPSPPR